MINTEAHYWPRCPKGNINTAPSSQGSGFIAEEGVEREQEPEAVNDCKKTLSPGHMGVAAQMNSYQLQQCVQNLRKPKLDQTPPLDMELLTTVSFWENERQFSQRVDSSKSTTLLWKTIANSIIWATQNWSWRIKMEKKNQSWACNEVGSELRMRDGRWRLWMRETLKEL